MRELPPETMTDAVTDQISVTWARGPRCFVSRWSSHHLDPHFPPDRRTHLLSACVGSGRPPVMKAARGPETG